MARSLLILFLTVTTLFSPAQAEREWGEPRHREPSAFREFREPRRHHRPFAFGGPHAPYRAGVPLLALPLVSAIPPVRGAGVPMSFEPPTRFRYHCNEPPGDFPALTVCHGPWLETGALPNQENRR